LTDFEIFHAQLRAALILAGSEIRKRFGRLKPAVVQKSGEAHGRDVALDRFAVVVSCVGGLSYFAEIRRRY
jgi:hypothetical protein